MKLSRVGYTGTDGSRRASKRWYARVRFRGTSYRVRGFTDRGATEELQRKLERLAAQRVAGELPDAALLRWIENLPSDLQDRLQAIGLLDARRLAAAKALFDPRSDDERQARPDALPNHVDDYRASLAAKGNTAQHVTTVAVRVRRLFDEAGFRFWSDVTGQAVQATLHRWRESGTAAQTLNHYLVNAKSFGRWMVRERRASESPLDHLQGLNVRAARKRLRRALTIDEARRLLEATAQGGARYGMSGPERALVYRLAIETGLRSSELSSLTRGSFSFGVTPPTVTVEARHSKRRRQDTVPLRADLMRDVEAFLRGQRPSDRAFAMPSRYRMAGIVRADLATAGIESEDESGRVLDFHSLRHTFCTNLARSGVHPKTAQALARHSTVELTLGLYSHVSLDDEAEAVAKLPNLLAASTFLLAATGTTGATDEMRRGSLPRCLPSSPGAQKYAAVPDGTNVPPTKNTAASVQTCENCQGELAEAEGFEPSKACALPVFKTGDGRASEATQGTGSETTCDEGAASGRSALATPHATSTPDDAELQAVLAAWPTLSLDVRRALVAIVGVR